MTLCIGAPVDTMMTGAFLMHKERVVSFSFTLSVFLFLVICGMLDMYRVCSPSTGRLRCGECSFSERKTNPTTKSLCGCVHAKTI